MGSLPDLLQWPAMVAGVLILAAMNVRGLKQSARLEKQGGDTA